MNWTRYDRLDRFGKTGWAIGAIRREQKLTDIEVAEKLHMDIKAYRRIERKFKTHSLTLQQVSDLGKIFDCSVEEFLHFF
ncbi:hypothetical protein A3C59_03990 [Candidatus Daviesbacteria bacterium RIFCSPHIGHO2_02_FULL_36_13]|uniref:HTH cro/C1-type domain-containing protein n=1 Tax=Candidatus Daviesbacteria bacterium RIFCSPHIGHO2_02_FULL_36_13 TaxID=1797768 RepID=A0A1F5JRC1_9BACT|nr:MAG: hypothetical protein A3C59_03990 [Candidatus Daviesbacteria bacterium RIFCSPHIGHO2_02_FULL_36_13]